MYLILKLYWIFMSLGWWRLLWEYWNTFGSSLWVSLITEFKFYWFCNCICITLFWFCISIGKISLRNLSLILWQYTCKQCHNNTILSHAAGEGGLSVRTCTLLKGSRLERHWSTYAFPFQINLLLLNLITGLTAISMISF